MVMSVVVPSSQSQSQAQPLNETQTQPQVQPRKGGKTVGKTLGKKSVKKIKVTKSKAQQAKEGVSGDEDSPQKRRKKPKPSWSRFILRTARTVHPSLSISKLAMACMCSLIDDMFERFAMQLSELSKLSKNITMSSRDVQTACKLLLSNDLARHAVAEGSKAVRLVNQNAASAASKKK